MMDFLLTCVMLGQKRALSISEEIDPFEIIPCTHLLGSLFRFELEIPPPVLKGYFHRGSSLEKLGEMMRPKWASWLSHVSG